MPSGTNYGLKETATANNPTSSNAAKSNTTPSQGLGTAYLVAGLPGSAPAWATAVVTDATVFTPGIAPTGGGAIIVPVFYNKVGWIMF